MGAPHVEFTCGVPDLRLTVRRLYLFRVPTLPGLPSAASERRQTGRVGVQTYAVESPLPTYLRDITLLVYENTV